MILHGISGVAARHGALELLVTAGVGPSLGCKADLTSGLTIAVALVTSEVVNNLARLKIVGDIRSLVRVSSHLPGNGLTGSRRQHGDDVGSG